jgi:glyoxylase-like metal-dependent hydrolase (beta-lactamase superfamily II)
MDTETLKLGEALKMIRIGPINYYILDNLLFDCGTTCTAKKLLGYLDNLNSVVISHGHFDHIAGLEVIKNRFPEARIFAHPRISSLLGKEKVVESWRREDEEFCVGFGEKAVYLKPSFEVEDASAINKSLKVVETPGHSADAISLLTEDGFMLVGDALGYPLANGNLPMFFQSFSAYITSIERISELADKVCLGHNGAVFESDYCNVAIEEAQKLKREIQEGMTEEELFKRIYRELKPYPAGTIRTAAKLIVKRALED